MLCIMTADATPTGRRRIPVSHTLTTDAIDWLDDLAHRYHLPRSLVVRASIAVAKKHEKDLTKTLEQIREQQ